MKEEEVGVVVEVNLEKLNDQEVIEDLHVHLERMNQDQIVDLEALNHLHQDLNVLQEVLKVLPDELIQDEKKMHPKEVEGEIQNQKVVGTNEDVMRIKNLVNEREDPKMIQLLDEEKEKEGVSRNQKEHRLMKEHQDLRKDMEGRNHEALILDHQDRVVQEVDLRRLLSLEVVERNLEELDLGGNCSIISLT